MKSETILSDSLDKDNHKVDAGRDQKLESLILITLIKLRTYVVSIGIPVERSTASLEIGVRH